MVCSVQYTGISSLLVAFKPGESVGLIIMAGSIRQAVRQTYHQLVNGSSYYSRCTGTARGGRGTGGVRMGNHHGTFRRRVYLSCIVVVCPRLHPSSSDAHCSRAHD